MVKILAELLALQKLELETKPLLLDTEREILAAREKVPKPMLDRFDRFIARGKRGVAVVRQGVCSECHLRITPGTLASLAYTSEIHVCDHCGRYLFLPETEPLGFAGSAPTKAAVVTPTRRAR